MLSAFTAEQSARTTAEISAELDLAPSTVRRLLQTLERHEYLTLDHESGRFSPHLELVRLAAVALGTSDLIRAAAGPADTLARDTGETVQLTVLRGADVVHVDGRESSHMWKIFHPVGAPHPVHWGGAAAKVLLAWQDRAVAYDVLAIASERAPGRTAPTRDEFSEELDLVAARGYAINDGATESEVWAVAAPVRDRSAEVVAALNLPCPPQRVREIERKQELTAATVHAAGKISLALGCIPGDRGRRAAGSLRAG